MDRGRRNHPLPLVRRPRPWLYAISDGGARTLAEARARLLPQLAAAARAGVDLIQIREKHLCGADLLHFCRDLRQATAETNALLLVNDRWDVAAAAGLDGVHLPSRGLPPDVVRRLAGPELLIGLSCHSTAEVHAARGCDFCVLGPVFATPSKAGLGDPLGTTALAAARTAGPPVLALGGITEARIAACLETGIAGIAAIRLFQTDAAGVVAKARKAGA